MKLHFYIVENDNKTLKPFILISKYNLQQIKSFQILNIYLTTESKVLKNKILLKWNKIKQKKIKGCFKWIIIKTHSIIKGLSLYIWDNIICSE